MPTVAALRERADAIVSQVLAENATRWESLSATDRERVEQMARAIANRLLHEPTVRIKGMADREDAYLQVSALRELFGLDAGHRAEAERRGRGRRLARREAPSQRTRLSGREAPLRLGTRGSALALAQAKRGRQGPRRRRDRADQDVRRSRRPTASHRGQGALRQGDRARRCSTARSTSAVHSAKDLPPSCPRASRSPACPRARTLATPTSARVDSLGEVPEGARIGTSSLRRRAQILALRPDLEVVELRGNVDTRLEQLEAGDFDGLVLAAAGLRGSAARRRSPFAIEADEFVPARGRARSRSRLSSDDRAVTAAESITDRGALGALTAERAVVAALDASCNTPLGANATLEDGGRMRLRAFCGPARRQRVAPRRARGGRLRPGGLGAAAGGADERCRGGGHPRRAEEMAAERDMAPGSSIWSAPGPGDPGPDDDPLARADRRGRRDRPRPADPRDALAGAPRPDAELIYVGKEPGRRASPQEGIADLLIDTRAAGQARRPAEGRRPVRLRPRRRGGRGARRGRRSPSRSSRASPPGVAAPAYAGIPVTHRDDASAVAFVTGHEDPDKEDSALDYEALAALPGHARLLHGRQGAAAHRRAA